MRKKLIEVALPLEAINAAAAREKSIRHGHPSTLHLWWARRPLAACRAVLFASLVDDPDSDPRFRALDGTVDVERAARKRNELFELIAELVKWENSNNPRVLNAARKEIARCVASQKVETGELARDAAVVAGATAWDFVVAGPTLAPEAVNAFLLQYAPPVLDPFCGGGSIPLEAQRLGLRAYASDLNPVAVLITKALIEIPPKFAGRPPVHPGAERRTDWPGATGLAEDVRYYGKWMRDEAEKRIGHLYPKVKVTKAMARERPDLEAYVGEELTVIAWLWARTVECPNPGCRARTPLVRSFWLSKKKGKSTFAQPILDREAKEVRFEMRSKGEPEQHSTDRTGARCLFCGTFIKKPQLRDIAMAQGVNEIHLALVAEGTKSRVYLPVPKNHLAEVPNPDVAWLAQPITNDRRWFSPPLYGMPNFADLFTRRQLVALMTFSDLVEAARKRVQVEAVAAGLGDDHRGLTDGGIGARAYADAVATYLAFQLDKVAEASTTICTWSSSPKNELVVSTFRRQALPMTWDFAEANPFAGSSGSLDGVLQFVCKAILTTPAEYPGHVTQIDATRAHPRAETPLFCTDPPYYDNIGYADLSDFFYVWLRRSLGAVYPSLFATMLVPKSEELVATPYRFNGSKDQAEAFFERGLGEAFVRMWEQQEPSYPLTIFYAFKQAEDEEEGTETGDKSSDEDGQTTRSSTGWETMLEGLMRARFAITGTWPMRTERGARSISIGTNALASSIVLVCRPRAADAPSTTRKEFLTALRRELPDALRELQASNIAPVDLAQAAIGPGMAVFSRYARVLEAGDKPMSVRTALGLINQTLDEVLAEQEGDFDPATRWTVSWFEQHGLEDGPFGVAETLSKAKNTAVNALVESGLVIARGGKVRLRKRSELPEGWEPADARCPVWEVTQRLVQTLENDGEAAAAALLPDLGGRAETARELAYRLYTICERKKWADEALAYNGLVIAWPELLKLALAHRTETLKQAEFFPEEGS